MPKWLNFFINKNSEIIPVLQEISEEMQFNGDYQVLDSPFREDVDSIVRASFPQQKIEDAPLVTNRQISCLDIPYSISEIPDIECENRQYRAWIRNIKTALQGINDYKNGWKNSIEDVLKELNSENDYLTERCERTAKEVSSLEELLEKIQKDNVEMINAIDSYQPLEPIKRYSFSSSTETIVPEEIGPTYARRISKESGYDSQGSSCSSTETIVPEEPDSIFVQTHAQIEELEKKNKMCKEWINSLNRKLDSNLTFNLIKLSNLKTFEDLKDPSFKNVELKQKIRENEEAIQSLEAQIIENIEINAAYQNLLSEEIRFHRSKEAYLDRLNELEELLNNEQKELEDIGNRFEKKAAQLHADIETFTECLAQTKKFISLLKI
ncbi:MAG TPA: hypothetical protein VGZ69_06085 [Candidatus Rhabdochlamydia sp.]|jgi:hypothetical protein|nr:hypothetical protein [Candidatus Rhabdochlamydia sp.]